MQDINRIAGQAMSHYEQRRRQVFPSYRMNTRRWDDEFWYRVGEKISSMEAEPRAWVDQAFECFKFLKVPQPNHLLSHLVEDAWRAATKGKPSEVRRLCSYQWQLFHQHSQLRSSRAILVDDQMPFNPLFRWIMAKRLGMTDLVEMFSKAAEQFRNSNPDHWKLLKVLDEEVA